MIRPFRFEKAILLQMLLFLIVSSNCVHAKSIMKKEVPLFCRYMAAFVDTVVIKSPVLVNINGIGYLNSKENLDFSNPTEVLDNEETCLLFCRFFYDKTVISDFNTRYKQWMREYSYFLNIETKKQLNKNSIEFPFDDILKLPFKYICTENGIDIYESEVSELQVFVYLIQIRAVNATLNPKIDFVVEMDSIYDVDQVRLVPSKYPELEYVRVAFPGRIIDDE